MGNSVRHYPGYDYGLAQGYASSGPLVLSCQRYGGKVHTLRIRNQAKQAIHSGPPLALAFSRSSHSARADSEKENNQETLNKLQVPQADPPMTVLHNSN
jgi:hypothetical protein